ncbi:MAG: hypothetical protein NPIRA06_12850 [Nitrospirales bacterium]|nr:MAG: hypothetical protein NPIRA06_12850 [Nitrospirales bacterium]
MFGGLLPLAGFSEVFLVLRAEHAGLSRIFISIVMVVMSVTYAASAYPSGRLADTISRRPILITGCLVLIKADVVLVVAGDVGMVLVGVAIGVFIWASRKASCPPSLRKHLRFLQFRKRRVASLCECANGIPPGPVRSVSHLSEWGRD